MVVIVFLSIMFYLFLESGLIYKFLSTKAGKHHHTNDSCADSAHPDRTSCDKKGLGPYGKAALLSGLFTPLALICMCTLVNSCLSRIQKKNKSWQIPKSIWLGLLTRSQNFLSTLEKQIESKAIGNAENKAVPNFEDQLTNIKRDVGFLEKSSSLSRNVLVARFAELNGNIINISNNHSSLFKSLEKPDQVIVDVSDEEITYSGLAQRA